MPNSDRAGQQVTAVPGAREPAAAEPAAAEPAAAEPADCTRWLDSEEQRAWRAFLRAAAQVDDALDRQLQRDAGMPHAYYQVLAMLSEAPDRTLRMSQLAGLTTSSASRLSHAVARLEEKGWVRRDRHPTDRRGALAVLTDAGWDALVEAAPGHVTAVRAAIFDRLDPEQVAGLRVISERIAGHGEA